MKKRQLPIAWNWNAASHLARPDRGEAASPGAEWQLEQLEAGRPIMPTIGHKEQEFSWEQKRERYTPLVLKAKELNLPIVFRSRNVFHNIKTWDYFKQFGFDPFNIDDHAWLVEEKILTPEQVLARFPEGIDPTTLPIEITKRQNELRFITELLPDGSAKYLHTTPNMSMWSYLTPEWCRQLGFLYGTTDLVKACAELYPEPEIMFFADNNEAGFDMPEGDIRAGIWYNKMDRIPIDNYIKGEGYEYAIFEQLKQNLKKYYMHVAKTAMFTEFNKGFKAGLATHNKHWAEVAGWVDYSYTGHEFQSTGNFRVDKGICNFFYSFDDSTYANPSWRSGEHKYGSTGSTYLNSWYGKWNLLRVWRQISNSRMYRDNAEIYSGWKPRFDLLWEGENRTDFPKPGRLDWRAFVKCALWIGHPEYFGHFCYSDTRIDQDEINVHYDEVINAVQEVYDNEELKDWWINGKLLESIDEKPDVSHNQKNPMIESLPWYFLHIEENERYSKEDPKYQWTDEVGFNNDYWRANTSNRSLVKAKAFAYEKDNEYLLFACSVLNPLDKITIRLTKDKTIVIDNPPIGGQFYIVKNDLSVTPLEEANTDPIVPSPSGI